jgi:hypothetical protein
MQVWIDPHVWYSVSHDKHHYRQKNDMFDGITGGTAGLEITSVTPWRVIFDENNWNTAQVLF